jgi:hypothetical protein
MIHTSLTLFCSDGGPWGTTVRASVRGKRQSLTPGSAATQFLIGQLVMSFDRFCSATGKNSCQHIKVSILTDFVKRNDNLKYLALVDSLGRPVSGRVLMNPSLIYLNVHSQSHRFISGCALKQACSAVLHNSRALRF